MAFREPSGGAPGPPAVVGAHRHGYAKADPERAEASGYFRTSEHLRARRHREGGRIFGSLFIGRLQLGGDETEALAPRLHVGGSHLHLVEMKGGPEVTEGSSKPPLRPPGSSGHFFNGEIREQDLASSCGLVHRRGFTF